MEYLYMSVGVMKDQKLKLGNVVVFNTVSRTFLFVLNR
jgi:hypothetical protein